MTLRTGQAAAREFMRSRPDWFLERLSKLNSTNFRIFATYSFIGATVVRYLLAKPLFGDDWKPSIEWLGFLSSLAGWDGAQFLVKRKTHGRFADDPAAGNGDPPANGVTNGGTHAPE